MTAVGASLQHGGQRDSRFEVLKNPCSFARNKSDVYMAAAADTPFIIIINSSAVCQFVHRHNLQV